MTKQKSVCNQQAMRFPTAFLVPHPETTESGVSRRWEDLQLLAAEMTNNRDQLHPNVIWPRIQNPKSAFGRFSGSLPTSPEVIAQLIPDLAVQKISQPRRFQKRRSAIL